MRLILLVSLYGIWVLLVRLLTLTFITYFTISPTSHFQDISDVFGSNEVSLMGLAALLFILLLRWLNPLNATSLSEIISRERIEKSFFPGFIQGSCLAGGLIAAFVISQNYRYLGFFIQFNEALLELANVTLRVSALMALAYCEGYFFYSKLPRYLKATLPDLASASLIAFLYCCIKLLQFDLGVMHLISLFLVSVALFFRSRVQFTKGAGFWAGILVVFHPLLSLPIFGNHFPGILLIKYQPVTSAPVDTVTRLLTGGAGGPLSSFAFQLLLILDIGRSILKQKKP